MHPYYDHGLKLCHSIIFQNNGESDLHPQILTETQRVQLWGASSQSSTLKTCNPPKLCGHSSNDPYKVGLVFKVTLHSKVSI
uniref:Uncharacterized protein n=1 Tax=Anguilla anguilla TaxID=7936 RepID=A0A0E9T8G2_ANGAN